MKEAYVAAALRESHDMLTYLPMAISQVRGVSKATPLFPGYLFVMLDLREVGPTRINQTPGVLRILSFGGEPQQVPKVVISAIKEQLQALNANGGPRTHNFRSGDNVVMQSGPFRGLQAVFVGPATPSARVKILLELLGRINEVKVDIEALTSTHDAPTRHNQRLTRGKGRRIKTAPAV